MIFIFSSFVKSAFVFCIQRSMVATAILLRSFLVIFILLNCNGSYMNFYVPKEDEVLQ